MQPLPTQHAISIFLHAVEVPQRCVISHTHKVPSRMLILLRLSLGVVAEYSMFDSGKQAPR